jgi:methyl-accepting chemotaxis protein
MPTCEDCHPCNTAWEDIITALEKNITSLIGNDSTVGPITNYNAEVAKLRKLMNELEDMLKNGKVTKAEVDQVRERTNKLREDMEVLQDRANAYTKRVNKTKDRTTEAIKKLDEFDQQTTKLKKDLDSLTKNATNVVESNVAGALNSTQESNKRSKAATKVVKSHVPDKDKNKDKEKTTVEKSKAKRRPIKKEFDLGKTDPPTRPFSEITAENDEIVKNLTTAVDEIELELKRLNGRLCGIKNDGSPCGGCTSVGCETCGEGCTGLVDQGVRKLAQDAVVKAQEAKNAFEKKQATAAEILEKVKEAAAAVAEAKKKSDEAEMKTGNAKKQGEVVRDRMKKIIEDINGFLGTVFNKPNKTIELATETLKLNLTLKPEAIKNLAKEIRELVKGLKDVDSILNDTKKDLNLANDLKKKALEAKKRALNVMAKADDVLDRLKKAQETQNNTRTLIKKANKDIDDAVNLVKKVQNSQLQIRNDLTNAEQALGPIQGKAKEAEQLFVKNKKDLDDTMVKVDKTDKLVKQAKDLKDQVETKFDDAQKKISDKEKLLDELRKRVKALGGRAIKLFETSELQMNTLDILHKRYLRNEERIKDLQDELRKMANQEIQIRDKMDVLLDCHAGCNPLNVKFCPELDNM